MLLTVEVPPEMTREIDRLIAEQRYPSHAALLRAALNNLLVQEKEAGTSPTLDVRVLKLLETQPSVEELAGSRTVVVSPQLVEEKRPPDWMPLNYLANRLLPVKAVGTLLLDYLQRNGVPRANLTRFSISAAEESVKLKGRLVRFDDSRDVKVSTSFPDPTPKGMQRFIQVYIGGRRANDTPFGAAASLGFIGFVASNSGHEEVALTERGYQLATAHLDLDAFIRGESDRLPDPLFDSEEFETLTSALLSHQGEKRLMKSVLKRLVKAPTQREDLNVAVRRHFELVYAEEVKSTNVIRAHAAATVLRLRELGLVEGLRSGGTVQYQLTERGQRWGEEVGL